MATRKTGVATIWVWSFADLKPMPPSTTLQLEHTMPGAKFHFLHYYEAFGKERCSSSNSGTGGTGSTEDGHLPTSGASGASGATRPHTAAESGDDGDDDGQERKEQETVRLRTDLGND